jgi:hypothetical protein
MPRSKCRNTRRRGVLQSLIIRSAECSTDQVQFQDAVADADRKMAEGRSHRRV